MVFLLGGCAGLAGCAPSSLQECDPANKGVIRYLRCSGAYDRRISELESIRGQTLALRAEADQLDVLASEAERLGKETEELRVRVDAAIKAAIRALEEAREQARKQDHSRGEGEWRFSGSRQDSEIGNILMDLGSLLIPGPFGILAKIFRASRAVRRAASILDTLAI